MIAASRGFVLFAALVLSSIDSAAGRMNGQGPVMTQGWVVSVRHGNGQGSFRIRTGSRIVNAGGLNPAGAIVAANTLQFTVVPGTQFEAVNSVGRMPTSFAALRSGQRVQVQAQGQQAVGVRILARNRSASGIRRSRSVGTGQRAHVARVNQTTPGLNVTGQAAQSKQRATSAQRKAMHAAKTHAVAHVSTKKR